MSEAAQTVTRLLRSWREGDAGAADELIPIVYEELRRVAAACLRGERPGHTLRPTDLVSEAYERLAAAAQPEWADRLQFFAIAARNMRQILVDHARRKKSQKRGGGERPVELDDNLVGTGRSDDILALDEALHALADHDERKAHVIEMFYFGGLTRDQIAQVLGLHANSITRDLKLAVAFLQRRMQQESGS